MKPSDVTAIVVTKGGVDLGEIIFTLRDFLNVIVWDNSQFPQLSHSLLKTPDIAASRVFPDFKVYGRYHAALVAMQCALVLGSEPFPVYVQDDDCITWPDRIVAEYEPGVVACNMPQEFRPNYQDGVALVGFGAVFDAQLIEPAFERYLGKYPKDDMFHCECDRVFTKLNRTKFVDVPVVNLRHAYDETRMFKRANHVRDTLEIRRRLETF